MAAYDFLIRIRVPNYNASQGRVKDGGYDELHNDFKFKNDRQVEDAMAKYDAEHNLEALLDVAYDSAQIVSVVRASD